MFSAQLPLTILSSILPFFVHLLLPSLVWPFTSPWRLQQLLEEREREEREEVVVEEVEDARFVRASTLLLPFPSSASPIAFCLTFCLFWAGISPPGVTLAIIEALPFHKTSFFYYIISLYLSLALLCEPLSSIIDPSRYILAFYCLFFLCFYWLCKDCQELARVYNESSSTQGHNTVCTLLKHFPFRLSNSLSHWVPCGWAHRQNVFFTY